MYIESGKRFDSKDKNETLSYDEYSNNDKKVALVYEKSKLYNLLNNTERKSASLPTLNLVEKPYNFGDSLF